MILLPPLENLLETTAVCTTVLQFLSGTVICRKFFQKKSTGETSGFPFLCGFLSCSLWLRYGILSDEDGVIIVNLIGTLLFLSYSLVYYIFTVNKKSYIKMFAIILVTLITVLLYINSLEATSSYEAHHLMGIICCIVSVFFFGAPLTMLFHVIRIKNSEPLPFLLIVMGFASSLQWLIFGIIISDTFVQIPNFLGCILSLLQLFLFVIYPPKNYPGQGYKLVEQTVVF